MPQRLPALIFDLDGTLTDSKPGILGCLRKVLDARNMGDCGPLERFIGPPVEQWAEELLPAGTEEERVALARDYRACYGSEGWRNNSVFAGVGEMLAQLHEAGFPLLVCTSKQEHFAVRILESFGLARFFTGIYGDKAEYESHSKVDLLARVLRERGLDRDTAWMVGDRTFDIEAAHENGIPCVAAGWGYGTPEEWAQADAVAVAPAGVLPAVSRPVAAV
ncbi:MAG: HAD hydrolase-like protein [Terracidiphilus sp.]